MEVNRPETVWLLIFF